MQTEPRPQNSLDAANALVAHLRRTPEAGQRSPRELAERFGLSEDFVQTVLSGIPDVAKTPEKGRKLSFGWIRDGWDAFSRTFDRWTVSPVAFIMVTTLLCIGFGIVVSRFAPGAVTARGGGSFQISNGLIVIGCLATLILHLGCYAFRGMSRWALKGALVVWMCTSTLIIVASHFGTPNPGESALFNGLFAGLAMFVLSGIYAGIGCLAALFGSYIRMRRLELAQERMTRQELLTRYFQLQTRLRQGERGPQTGDWLESLAVVRAFRRHPTTTASAINVLVTAVSLSLLLAAGLPFGQAGAESIRFTPVQMLALLVQATLGLSQFALNVLYGFLLVRAGRTIRVATVAYLVSGAIGLLPIAANGQTVVQAQGGWGTYLTNTAILLVLTNLVALLGALGGRVQARASQERSLQRNDPASLLAEMLRIQMRLSDADTTVCVLVVDAARSSEMKLNADPLAVEFSFREYQNWIERISAKFGGRVHSTAGDGAVVAFPNCVDAFLAAKQIQTDVGRFNEESNRLALPFRLRIGLHVGEVAGDLDQVQFTAVIDVAAHIEAVSLVGGIAASEPVVDQLVPEDWIAIADIVDGYRVFHAVNPR